MVSRRVIVFVFSSVATFIESGEFEVRGYAPRGGGGCAGCLWARERCVIMVSLHVQRTFSLLGEKGEGEVVCVHARPSRIPVWC